MRILYLSRWFPYPANNGSRLRIYHTLAELAARHEMHLLSFADTEPQPEHLAHMRTICASVTTVPWRVFAPMRFSALRGFVSTQPRSLVDTYSTEMERQMQQVAQQVQPEIAIASQIDTAPYLASLQGVTRILDELELGFLYGKVQRASTVQGRLRAKMTWAKAQSYYRRLLDSLDGFTLVSDVEQRLANELIKSHTPSMIVPNGVEMPPSTALAQAPEADMLIYCGSPTFAANLHAVAYFVSEILPRVAAARPNVRLYVTGALPADQSILPRDGDHVIFTGELPEVRSLLARSWASVVPLLEGGGTRLKILESMAVGTPVVSTSKGMEGLRLQAGSDLLCADTPEAFAAATIRLLESAPLREELSTQGRTTVAAHYQWHNIIRGFEHFIDEAYSSRFS